jgi:hypothetical protein
MTAFLSMRLLGIVRVVREKKTETTSTGLHTGSYVAGLKTLDKRKNPTKWRNKEQTKAIFVLDIPSIFTSVTAS